MTVFISAHQSNYQLFTLRAARSERFVFPGFESLSTLGAVVKVICQTGENALREFGPCELHRLLLR